MTQPKIKQAAIKTDDGQIHTTNKPGRHHDIIKQIRQTGYKGPIGGNRQGFITDDNQFVDRQTALQIAINTNQTQLDKCHAPKTGLFSEDLW